MAPPRPSRSTTLGHHTAAFSGLRNRVDRGLGTNLHERFLAAKNVQTGTEITTMGDLSPGSAVSGITPTVSPSPAKNAPHHGLFMQAVVIPTRPPQSTAFTSRENPGKMIPIADPPRRRSVLDAVVIHKSRAQSSLAMWREKNRSKIPLPVGKEEQFQAFQDARPRSSSLTLLHVGRSLRVAIRPRYVRLMQQTAGTIASAVTRSSIPIPIGKEQEFLALSAAVHRMSKNQGSDTGMEVTHAPKLVASVATGALEATESPLSREKPRSRIPVPMGKEEQFEVLQEADRRTSALTAAHVRRWLRVAIIPRYFRLMQQTEGTIASAVTRSSIPIPIGKEQEFLALSAAVHRMSNKLANDTGMQVPHAPKLFGSVATPELEAPDSPIVAKRKSSPLHKWAPPIDKRVIFIPGEQ
jgi:hypothetical protein